MFPKKYPKIEKPKNKVDGFSTTKKELPKFSATKKNLIDNRVHNTKRGMTQETIEAVLERDNYKCVVCGKWEKEARADDFFDFPHHAHYWPQANHSENRNDVSQLVTIHHRCHAEIHDKGNQIYRQACISYLEEKYGN